MSGNEDVIAVNIALLLDKQSSEKCRVISDTLEKNGGKGLLMDGSAPHITLWMGLVYRDEVKVLAEWVKSIDLKIILHNPEIVFKESGQMDIPLVHLVFEEGDLIRSLHEAAHRRGDAHLLRLEPTDIMFLGDEISDSTRLYTLQFHDKHSIDNFEPHITIGYGRTSFFIGDEPLVADRVGIFQMGNACTCKKNLIEM